MPVIQLKLNTEISEEEKNILLLLLAKLTSSVLNKPLEDVMVLIDRCDIIMGENFEPAALIDVKCISGLNKERAEVLCDGISVLLNERAGVDKSRTYVNFSIVHHEHAWRFINNQAACAQHNHPCVSPGESDKEFLNGMVDTRTA